MKLRLSALIMAIVSCIIFNSAEAFARKEGKSKDSFHVLLPVFYEANNVQHVNVWDSFYHIHFRPDMGFLFYTPGLPHITKYRNVLHYGVWKTKKGEKLTGLWYRGDNGRWFPCLKSWKLTKKLNFELSHREDLGLFFALRVWPAEWSCFLAYRDSFHPDNFIPIPKPTLVRPYRPYFPPPPPPPPYCRPCRPCRPCR